ncbi:HepT-like ribonuclease domain-containing protein [Aerolutibacter ruishenii]|uniref:Uncharacterized protein with HEPN domain n=1 Tax=Aerolutibacter ruishenii TaxID=686800 RepID=A0A562LPM3_9GAMM|nr:DUF86 domain-containing protein [Lysobacter ruishenii]TWI09552.1 uncharacterized protein with HEPN domain [Lysobacter ruishenii]
MTQDRLADYLAQSSEAIRLAMSYVDGMTKDAFMADKRTQQAVILNLMVLGEIAAKVLQDHGEFARQHGAVPWRSMKGMRNRIAHGYFEVDLEVVWETVQSALPGLRVQLDDTARGFTP